MIFEGEKLKSLSKQWTFRKVQKLYDHALLKYSLQVKELWI